MRTALGLVCAAVLSGCGGVGDGAAPPGGGPPGRWPACDPSATEQTVSFVHMNDLHGRYDRDGTGAPKVARIRGYFEAVAAENPFTVFTNGGDDYEKGSVVEVLSDYAATREVTQAMRFDARVIGNHDLAWSQEELLRYAQDDHALVLASNLEYLGDDPVGFGAVRYGQRQVGCVTVGFLGAVSAPWNEQNETYAGDYYEQFPTDLDFVRVHRELVGEHRDAVDLLVAVSHLGVGDDLLVAEQAPGLDVILGGHSHTAIFEPEVVGDTLVVQAGSSAGYVARLDLTVDLARREVVDHRYELRIVAGDLAPDPETDQAVGAILDRHGPNAVTPLGRIAAQQPARGAIALAARAALAELGADAAAFHLEAAFAGISRGPVSQQDLFDAFKVERQPAGTPGWTATYLVEVSGADLARLAELDAAEWAVELPATIDPAGTYTLALPKFAALGPERHLPAGVTLGGARVADETWAVLERYARARTTACLHLDADQPLPDCAP